MLLVACFVLCLASVPLAGGRVMALADLRLARSWALGAALAIQVAIVSLWPEGAAPAHAAAHLLSYALIVCFLTSNRGMPGLVMAGVGTVMNLSAIAANGGVMPATRGALAAAGRFVAAGHFANSTVLAHPKLAFLGDVFAWPSPLPLANVFSAGDVCIVVGAAMILHQVCGSRLTSTGFRQRTRRPLVPLRSVGSSGA